MKADHYQKGVCVISHVLKWCLKPRSKKGAELTANLLLSLLDICVREMLIKTAEPQLV